MYEPDFLNFMDEAAFRFGRFQLSRQMKTPLTEEDEKFLEKAYNFYLIYYKDEL